MKWKISPKIKIYEALGCLSDKRIITSDREIKVFSSSRKKYYTVKYNGSQNAIMSNDNGSFWMSYLGYPSIAYLMSIGELPFNQEFSNALKNIPWKEINSKNNNDFKKTIAQIDRILINEGVDIRKFYQFINEVEKAIQEKRFNLLGEKQQPPKEN